MNANIDELKASIRSAKVELEESEAKCIALRSYIDGQEAMLRFLMRGYADVDKVSVREAVLAVLRNNAGMEMTTRLISESVDWESTGSKARNKQNAVDGAISALVKRGEPIEKAGVRTWRWEGEEEVVEETIDPDDLPF